MTREQQAAEAEWGETTTIPGLPGEWVKRERFPNGLDAALTLSHIAYCHYGQWETGITSSEVQYWIRVDEGTKPKGQS